MQPDHENNTQIEIAKQIKERDGQIDHLVVWLGANNCLGTVVELDIRVSGDHSPGSRLTFEDNRRPNLWTVSAFKQDYEKLVQEVKAIGATNVYLGTVPYVTIPPVSRGVNQDARRLKTEDGGYYDYYTRFSVRDKDFINNPNRYPHLLKEEAQYIDKTIQEYNSIIREAADQNNWTVIDLADVLNKLAARRNLGAPSYQLPRAFENLSTRFFEVYPNGTLKNGGLIGLDGVHPTTAGYAIVAREVYRAIQGNDPNLDSNVDRAFDFAAIRRRDTLLSRPPRTLDDAFEMLHTLEKHFGLSKLLAGS